MVIEILGGVVFLIVLSLFIAVLTFTIFWPGWWGYPNTEFWFTKNNKIDWGQKPNENGIHYLIRLTIIWIKYGLIGYKTGFTRFYNWLIKSKSNRDIQNLTKIKYDEYGPQSVDWVKTAYKNDWITEEQLERDLDQVINNNDC